MFQPRRRLPALDTKITKTEHTEAQREHVRRAACGAGLLCATRPRARDGHVANSVSRRGWVPHRLLRSPSNVGPPRVAGVFFVTSVPRPRSGPSWFPPLSLGCLRVESFLRPCTSTTSTRRRGDLEDSSRGFRAASLSFEVRGSDLSLTAKSRAGIRDRLVRPQTPTCGSRP